MGVSHDCSAASFGVSEMLKQQMDAAALSAAVGLSDPDDDALPCMYKQQNISCTTMKSLLQLQLQRTCFNGRHSANHRPLLKGCINFQQSTLSTTQHLLATQLCSLPPGAEGAIRDSQACSFGNFWRSSTDTALANALPWPLASPWASWHSWQYRVDAHRSLWQGQAQHAYAASALSVVHNSAAYCCSSTVHRAKVVRSLHSCHLPILAPTLAQDEVVLGVKSQPVGPVTMCPAVRCRRRWSHHTVGSWGPLSTSHTLSPRCRSPARPAQSLERRRGAVLCQPTIISMKLAAYCTAGRRA
jgi:hypothetical protein